MGNPFPQLYLAQLCHQFRKQLAQRRQIKHSRLAVAVHYPPRFRGASREARLISEAAGDSVRKARCIKGPASWLRSASGPEGASGVARGGSFSDIVITQFWKADLPDEHHQVERLVPGFHLHGDHPSMWSRRPRRPDHRLAKALGGRRR